MRTFKGNLLHNPQKLQIAISLWTTEKKCNRDFHMVDIGLNQSDGIAWGISGNAFQIELSLTNCVTQTILINLQTIFLDNLL